MSALSPTAVIAGINDADRQIVLTLYRAFSENRPELMDVVATPDWQDIPLAPGQQQGRDGIKPLIGAFKTAFPDMTITIHTLIAAGGNVAVRGEITGTHLGDWFGVPATGRRFSMPIHEFHRVEGGRITHTWHLEDWLGWFFQMGINPAGGLAA